MGAKGTWRRSRFLGLLLIPLDCNILGRAVWEQREGGKRRIKFCSKGRHHPLPTCTHAALLSLRMDASSRAQMKDAVKADSVYSMLFISSLFQVEKKTGRTLPSLSGKMNDLIHAL